MDKIKVVVFDLDGTIGDTLPLCIAAFKAAIQPLTNRTLTDAEIIATFGPSEEGTIHKLVPEHYTEAIAGYLNHYKNLHAALCPAPFDGITDVLQHLQQHGTGMAMVTGKGVHSTQLSLSRFGLVKYFAVVETGIAAGPNKVAGILNVIDHFKEIPKHQFLYVGDAPSDVEACRKAGIPIAAAAWASTAEPGALLALQPDKIFYTINDFAGWLFSSI